MPEDQPLSPPSQSSAKSAAPSLADMAKRVTETGLFDYQWYVQSNAEAAALDADPLAHYLTKGEAQGRSPNRLFSPDYYRSVIHQAADSDGAVTDCLLLHYATIGWKEGLSPSPSFSNRLYLETYPDVARDNTEPLRHYLTHGEKEGRQRFSTLQENMDRGTALLHERIKATRLFYDEWYLSHHFDLYGQGVDALEHYLLAGSDEGRMANPYFDTGWYRDTYRYEIGDEHPLVFWAEQGFRLGHDPAPNFSSAVYFKENPDLTAGEIDPLAHFLTYGRFEGRGWPDPARLSRVNETVAADPSAKLPVDDALRGLIDYPRNPLKPQTLDYDPDALDIHWMIPDFAAGGGGHMTIFRMVHFLELRGHKQTIWIHNPTLHETPDDAFDSILKHFQHFTGDVRFVDETLEGAGGDVIIASDCFSVWPAMVPTNFKRRFYFVQDHEPSFHPVGSHSLAAEMSYREDFDCICASPWLEKLMREKHDKWARYFWLAADTKLYFPQKEPHSNTVPRIAVYARTFTARRLVELSLLGLEVLGRRGVDFHVDFFGAPVPFKSAPFSFKDHGVAKPETLANLFRKADIGVVFSATNYSLVPQEMMACGLPIIEFDGENTRTIFNENIVTFASPDPIDIANTLEDLLNDQDRRDIQSQNALEWVRQYSWPASAQMVERHIKERLKEFGQAILKEAPAILPEKPKASVVIPTYNPGPLFPRVLKAVMNQKARFNFDILVIDSGSTDGTVDLLDGVDGVRFHAVDKADFNHGDTRNLGAEMTDGDYVAFLTHDALPRDDRWLHAMVTGMDKFPNAGGVFGRHLAWPSASPFTKRDLEAHFDQFLQAPLYLDRDTDRVRFDARDPQWMQTLHFYSDNNSMLRRSCWEKIPMRRTKFGEDHLYAYDIIMAGYGKLYMPHGVVYHSHDYTPEETRERCGIESAFFKHYFGYRLMDDQDTLQTVLQQMNERDTLWGEQHGVSEAEINLQKKLNEARLMGHFDGCMRDTKGEFE